LKNVEKIASQRRRFRSRFVFYILFLSKMIKTVCQRLRNRSPSPWTYHGESSSKQPVYSCYTRPTDRPTEDDVFFFRPNNYRGQETHRKSLQSQSAGGVLRHWTNVCNSCVIREGSSRKRNGMAWRISQWS